MADQDREYTEIERLRALAHPLRAELYYRLVGERRSTASRLAEQVLASPSLVSYHLRELAKHGFAAAAGVSDGDNREQWWEVREIGVRFPAPQGVEDPAERVVLDQMEWVTYLNQLRRIEEYRRSREEWGCEWAQAAFSADFILKLTPEGLADLYSELDEVVTRHVEANPSGEDRLDDERIVTVMLYGFPLR